jgi:phospho-N-acetylmuramoyl-pentapeptide-transferase
MDFSNIAVWEILCLFLGFGVIGFYDDYRKVKMANSKGLSGRLKLLFQFTLSGFISYFLVTYFLPNTKTALW